MAGVPGGIRVALYGQIVHLQSLQYNGGNVPLFNDAALTDQVVFPLVLSVDATFYVDGGWSNSPLTLAALLHTGDTLAPAVVSPAPHQHALAAFAPNDIQTADITSRGSKLLVLNSGDPVPAGTLSGTVILRRP